MESLPVPEHGGSVDELRQMVNLPDDEHWRLVVAWLVAALRPTGPYPALAVNGEQGSAKSTLCRMLRALIDPYRCALRRPPRDERDLMIAASNGWVVCFDNLSGIKPSLSDALCCLSTGGGFATRELYSDDEEKLFEAQRPILLNGIDEIATRPDLLDRALSLTLPTIADDRRCDEAELWERFEQARPRILGALLGAVSAALANVGQVQLDRLPRMADFARWATAAEPALGWEPGAFMEAYAGNRAVSVEHAIESAPIGPALMAMLNACGQWSGTAGELLEALQRDYASEQDQRRKGWPGTPQGMANALRRLAPSLRAWGIAYQRPTPQGRDRRRVLVLESEGETSSASSASSANGVSSLAGGIEADGSEHNADEHREQSSLYRPPQNSDGSPTERHANATDDVNDSIPARSADGSDPQWWNH